MADSPLAFQAGRAAMYVRMSTEHQQYSTENQADAIQKYADQHNFSIVKTFVDYGKSGLRLSSRLGSTRPPSRGGIRHCGVRDHSGLRCQPLGTVSGYR